MKTEHRSVAKCGSRHPSALHPEGMSSIVDYLETVALGHPLYAIDITEAAINVHGHDGTSARRDGGFDGSRIEREIVWAHIDKHGGEPLALDSVGGRGEAVGCGNHLAT